MNYLVHYGIVGMRWGVRRYQNYDGTYTQAGLKRYKAAISDYEKAKAKGDKVAMKTAKKAANKHYKQLKYDKMADQGKKLYSKGKTITDNQKQLELLGGTIAASVIANNYFVSQGAETAAKISFYAGIGASAVQAVLTGKNSYENRRLRAYYAH